MTHRRLGPIFFIVLWMGTQTLVTPAPFGIGEEAMENNQLEIAYGKFSMTDARYKKVYKSGREMWSLEIFRKFIGPEDHSLGLSAGYRYFTKSGSATITQESTRLTFHNTFLALRYIIRLGFLLPWLEAGIDRVDFKENSSIIVSSGAAVGYHIQGGVFIRIPKIRHVKIKISARHTSAVKERNGIKADLGGFEVNIGIAFGFNGF